MREIDRLSIIHARDTLTTNEAYRIIMRKTGKREPDGHMGDSGERLSIYMPDALLRSTDEERLREYASLLSKSEFGEAEMLDLPKEAKRHIALAVLEHFVSKGSLFQAQRMMESMDLEGTDAEERITNGIRRIIVHGNGTRRYAALAASTFEIEREKFMSLFEVLEDKPNGNAALLRK